MTSRARRTRRINLLYKNLGHVSDVYFAEEGVFPYWETVFALIIGQIFIAYFNSGGSIWLAFFGFILSLIWFILVSLNYQNALYTGGKVRDLQDRLNTELIGDASIPLREFVYPWPSDTDKEKWTLRSIFWGTRPDETPSLKKVIKSTWLYRRILPLVLLAFWGVASLFIILQILCDP